LELVSLSGSKFTGREQGGLLALSRASASRFAKRATGKVKRFENLESGISDASEMVNADSPCERLRAKANYASSIQVGLLA
jgi:hypothetical protein